MHSNKFLTIKTGQGPAHRRNLRTRNWHTAYAMDWLKEYDDRMLEGCDEAMSTEQDEMQYSLLTTTPFPSLFKIDFLNLKKIYIKLFKIQFYLKLVLEL